MTFHTSNARRAAALSLATACASLAGCARGGAPSPEPLQPAVFAPGVISDAREQWRLTFTPDGDTAYFAASDGFFPITRRATIYVSHRMGSGWSAPAVADFSGTHADIDPAISPDGRRLYFSSIRPVDGAARGDIDVWMVERTAGGRWGAPVRLGDEVNSDLDELYPSVSRDGALFVAAGPRAPSPGSNFDIYRAERRGEGFAPRVALGAGVNRQPAADDPHPQAAWEFNPEISPDGRTLVFTSLRPGGQGLGDLYVSHLRGGAWTPARNLGAPVNTAADEYHPTWSRDGAWLYFVRRNPLPGDFHRVPARALAALQPPALTGLLDALQQAGVAQQQNDFAETRRLLRAAYAFAPDYGAVLYFLLTGRKPFDSDDPTATLSMVLTQEPPRPRDLDPRIPEGLELVVQRAMAKDPRDRYATMTDLDHALAALDDGRMRSGGLKRCPSDEGSWCAIRDSNPEPSD